MSIDEIIQKFRSEFGVVADCFSVLKFTVDEANRTVDPRSNRPGVYVYWHPKYDVILVGKSQSNSKKRSLQHILDNSRNDVVSMSDIANDASLRLLLFNVSEDSSKHWVLALEAFFEWNIDPVIKAWRIG